MKRYFTLLLVFSLIATLFAGCGNKDNVSHNENGMIESSTTESSAVITVPTTQNTTTPTTHTESSGLMEDMLPDGNTQDGSSPSESSSQNGNGRSRRSMPRF